MYVDLFEPGAGAEDEAGEAACPPPPPQAPEADPTAAGPNAYAKVSADADDQLAPALIHRPHLKERLRM